MVEALLASTLLIPAAYLKLGGQNRMFYSPQRNAVQYDNPQLRPVETYTSDGVKLRGFLIEPPDASNMTDVTILYLHGTEFNPATKLPRLMEFAYIMNCQILVFNYRGYSYSDKAACSEEGIQKDAQAIFSWIMDNNFLVGSQLYLMGKSFGAAVAVYMAAKVAPMHGTSASKTFKGVILESAFTSAEEMYIHKTKGLIPKTFFSDNQWKTIYSIQNIGSRTLLLHGGNDDVCPVSMVYELHKRRPESELLVIPHAGHN